ncbi:MAG: hypothetical protein AAGE01_02030 [Pseudomonadota bacterium]
MMGFIERLKQGRMFRVATAYGLVAWLLVQAADVFVPALHLPEWTLTLVAGLALLGFPIALVLAWAYDASHRPETGNPAEASARSGQLLNSVLMGVVILAVVFLFVDRFVLGREDPEPPVSASDAPAPKVRAGVVLLPEDAPIAMGVAAIGIDSPPLALMPDGRTLVYVAREGDGSRLYQLDLRGFDAPRPVPGTAGAVHAFAPPTGSEVGFLTNERVQAVDLDSGVARPVMAAIAPGRGFWLSGDAIWIADEQSVVLRRQGTGTSSETSLLVGGTGAVSAMRDDGQRALSMLKSSSMDGSHGDILWTDTDSGESRKLSVTGFDARLLPGEEILVFVRGHRLFAARFDAENGVVLGGAKPVVAGLAVDPFFGHGHFAVGADGTLAYVPGGDLSRGEIVAVRRDGTATSITADPQGYGAIDLSADDRTIAAHLMDVEDDVLLIEVATGGGRKVPGSDGFGWPKWSRDGGLALTAVTPNFRDTAVVIMRAASTRLEPISGNGLFGGIVGDWSPDGSQVSISTFAESRIGFLATDGSQQIDWLTEAGEHYEWGPAYSPDGRWVAYSSDETGRFEAWVRSTDRPEVRRQVSTGGGIETVWCPCGEVFFRRGDRFLSATVSTDGGVIEVGPEIQAFELPGFLDTPGRSYDVSSDGSTLYTVRRVNPPLLDRIHVMSNWVQSVKQLLDAP